MIEEIRVRQFIHGVYAKDELGEVHFHRIEAPEAPPGEYAITFETGRQFKYSHDEFSLMYTSHGTRAWIGNTEYKLSDDCRMIVENCQVGH